MKFIIKTIMEGDFPGSPDTDTFEVTELMYDSIRKYIELKSQGDI